MILVKFAFWTVVMGAVGSFSGVAEAFCTQSPLRAELEKSQPKPTRDGVYQLERAETSWDIESERITLQWLQTPVGPVVSTVCPENSKIQTSPDGFLIRTESLLGTVQVRDGKALLIDGSQLFDVTALIVDQEIHPQESRASELSFAKEGLSAESLQEIPSLKVRWVEAGLIIEYLDVIALYERTP